MRMDLAAQVNLQKISIDFLLWPYNFLLGSQLKCLIHTLGEVAKETARFADMFDKFFDALNVCNFDSGKHERKPFKDPYRSPSDFRLKVS